MERNMVKDKKTISITGKRQITIPLKYYQALGFGKEAECVMRNNEIVIRPIKENTGGEFAEQILADLISQGYGGNELLSKFRIAQKNVRPAVERMLKDAAEAANGRGEFYKYDDIFDTEN
jgi:bifunctional DNA-binding transcriptional regulator/antitoxin component of YhaV-PrlF toxin-antitoxin module